MITHRKENIKQHRYHFQNSKVQIIKGPDGEGEKKKKQIAGNNQWNY